jgi:hypothetical protein
MKYIKQLFGLKDQVKIKIQTTFTTVGIHQLPYEEWCKELRVSMLHGRTVVYMD